MCVACALTDWRVRHKRFWVCSTGLFTSQGAFSRPCTGGVQEMLEKIFFAKKVTRCPWKIIFLRKGDAKIFFSIFFVNHLHWIKSACIKYIRQLHTIQTLKSVLIDEEHVICHCVYSPSLSFSYVALFLFLFFLNASQPKTLDSTLMTFTLTIQSLIDRKRKSAYFYTAQKKRV